MITARALQRMFCLADATQQEQVPVSTSSAEYRRRTSQISIQRPHRSGTLPPSRLQRTALRRERRAHSATKAGPYRLRVRSGKKTRLFGEKATIDFRASFFNMFNRHIFSVPDNVFGPGLQKGFTPAGGTNCKQALACNFGAVTDSSGPRTIQFGLKIAY